MATLGAGCMTVGGRSNVTTLGAGCSTASCTGISCKGGKFCTWPCNGFEGVQKGGKRGLDLGGLHVRMKRLGG